jgi:hypothetical protein
MESGKRKSLSSSNLTHPLFDFDIYHIDGTFEEIMPKYTSPDTGDQFILVKVEFISLTPLGRQIRPQIYK